MNASDALHRRNLSQVSATLTDGELERFLTDGLESLLKSEHSMLIQLRPLFKQSRCAKSRCLPIMEGILYRNSDHKARYEIDEDYQLHIRELPQPTRTATIYKGILCVIWLWVGLIVGLKVVEIGVLIINSKFNTLC
jgi:hypothetical protein